MNSQDFTRAKTYTKLALLIAVVVASPLANADWSVDFSRRTKAIRDSDLLDGRSRRWDDTTTESQPVSREPASVPGTVTELVPAKTETKGIFDTLFDAGEPTQDIVIMQTEKGFVPATVRVRKNGRYKIHVVNVNEKEKNVSFILDGFSEHHATYYGKIKTFDLEPKKEGAFSFQSPETSAEGKLIVFNPEISIRTPATTAAVEGVPQK